MRPQITLLTGAQSGPRLTMAGGMGGLQWGNLALQPRLRSMLQPNIQGLLQPHLQGLLQPHLQGLSQPHLHGLFLQPNPPGLFQPHLTGFVNHMYGYNPISPFLY